MTTDMAAAPVRAPTPGPTADGRGSWVPTPAMIATRFMELRRRRGLMLALAGVTIGIPTLVLVIRLIAHAVDPKSYSQAGGFSVYQGLIAGVLYIFGFIIAAVVGCTAGTSDLGDGMFRHLVITGRSRVALYLARIPAGLAIVVTMVALGVTIVSFVCVFAAPTRFTYTGLSVPANLSKPALETWAVEHADAVICDFGSKGPVNVAVSCPNGGPGPGGFVVRGGQVVPTHVSSTPAAIRAAARTIAAQNYASYRNTFLYPSDWLMIRSGLWIELEAAIGFLVGLGLASLIGQRTISVVLMIVLELFITPLLARAHLAHFINLQRSLVGLATAHLEPAGLPVAFGGGGRGNGPDMSSIVPEGRPAAVIVIVAWIVGWSVIGAWRMATRDA